MLTAQQLERICRSARKVQRDEARYEGGVPETGSRYVMTQPMADGTVQIIAQLHADEAALVVQAIDAMREERMKEQMTLARDADQASDCSCADDAPDDSRLPATQDAPAPIPTKAWPCRADALVHLAERVLVGEERISGADRCTIEVRFGRDALGEGVSTELEDGTRVPAETFRRLACDAGIVPTLEAEDGETLDVGRKTRRISPALRRALRSRQPTCAFPGCGHRRFLDAHHVEHWIDGGETKLSNLVHLCPIHHRLVHEDGFRVELAEDGRALFRTPDRKYIAHVPPRSRGNVEDARFDDVGARVGIPLHPDVNLPRWDGRRPDYHECVRAVLPR